MLACPRHLLGLDLAFGVGPLKRSPPRSRIANAPLGPHGNAVGGDLEADGASPSPPTRRLQPVAAQQYGTRSLRGGAPPLAATNALASLHSTTASAHKLSVTLNVMRAVVASPRCPPDVLSDAVRDTPCSHDLGSNVKGETMFFGGPLSQRVRVGIGPQVLLGQFASIALGSMANDRRRLVRWHPHHCPMRRLVVEAL